MTSKSNRHKTIFVIDAMTFGGAQHLILQLAESMSTIDKELILLMNAKVEVPVLPHTFQEVSRINSKSAMDFFAFLRFLRFIKKSKPEVIFAHLYLSGIWSLLASRLLGTRCIYVEHNVYIHRSKSQWSLLRLLLSKTNSTVVAVSEEVRRNLLHKGVSKRKCISISNPAPVESIRIGDTSLKPMNFVHIGRLTKHKNPTKVLKVFAYATSQAKFPEARLHFFGDGPEMPRLIAEIENLGVGDRVLIHGLVEKNELLAALTRMHCLISLSDYEGSPLSRIEALSAGLCVITTRTGGIEDLVSRAPQLLTNGIGVVDSPEEIKEISSLMLEMTKGSLWTEEAIEGRVVVQKLFSIENVTREYLDLFVLNQTEVN